MISPRGWLALPPLFLPSFWPPFWPASARRLLSTLSMGTVAFLVILSFGVSSCASHSPEHTGHYDLGFPSEEALIQTTFVDVEVFDSSETTTCTALLELRRTHQKLPTPIREPQIINTCALLSAAGASPLPIPDGDHLILAVGLRGERADEDYLLGCSRIVGADAQDVVVRLTLIKDVPIGDPGNCQTLADRCSSLCSISASPSGDASVD